MEWYKNLYLGEQAAKKKLKLLKKINKKFLSNAYIVALPSNPANVLDIYPYNEFLQKHRGDDDVFAVGLACGKDEAYEVVKDIVWDVYSSSGNFKVSDYIRKREDA